MSRVVNIVKFVSLMEKERDSKVFRLSRFLVRSVNCSSTAAATFNINVGQVMLTRRGEVMRFSTRATEFHI